MSVIRFLAGRIVWMFIILWMISSALFFAIRIIPGDPVVAVLGEGVSAGDAALMRSRMGLHQPLYRQYLDYFRNLAGCNLGISWTTGKPVFTLLKMYTSRTLRLSLCAGVLALLISLPLGITAAARPNSWIDVLTIGVATVGVAIPNYFLGLLFILLFSVYLHWLPVSGATGVGHIVLPAFTLALSMSASITRLTRTLVATEMNKSYVLLARAKGLSTAALLKKHVLVNMAPTLFTLLGSHLAGLLSGVVITETVFSWPGVGTLLIHAVHGRDLPVVEGVILLFLVIYLTLHFIIETGSFFLNPKVRRGGAPR